MTTPYASLALLAVSLTSCTQASSSSQTAQVAQRRPAPKEPGKLAKTGSPTERFTEHPPKPMETSTHSPPKPEAVEPGTGTPIRPPNARPHPEMVEIRKSMIPGAGQGLFARVDIPAGTYLGPYTGTYVTEEEMDNTDDKAAQYLFFIPPCANNETYAAILGDQRDYVSKVNFAPATINGQPTGLQNVDFDLMCSEPYARLYSTQPIRAGEELYSDYGEDYDYFFMAFPEVQNHFLRVTSIPARQNFTWEYAHLQ